METRALSAYAARGLNARRPFATIVHAPQRVGSDAQALDRLASEGQSLLLIDEQLAPVPGPLAPVPGPLAPVPGPLATVSPRLPGAADRVRLLENTFNRNVFGVESGRDGYLVLGLPWLPGFEGRVDDAPAGVVRANALYPAVYVPRGHHRVELRFVSRPFLAGLGLAMLGTTVWALWLAPSHRLAALVASLLLCAAFAGWMRQALFHGPSLGNRYEWRSEAPNER
jgi:hypothetical protein